MGSLVFASAISAFLNDPAASRQAVAKLERRPVSIMSLCSTSDSSVLHQRATDMFAFACDLGSVKQHARHRCAFLITDARQSPRKAIRVQLRPLARRRETFPAHIHGTSQKQPFPAWMNIVTTRQLAIRRIMPFWRMLQLVRSSWRCDGLEQYVRCFPPGDCYWNAVHDGVYHSHCACCA